jgi:hypothetical protein
MGGWLFVLFMIIVGVSSGVMIKMGIIAGEELLRWILFWVSYLCIVEGEIMSVGRIMR